MACLGVFAQTGDLPISLFTAMDGDALDGLGSVDASLSIVCSSAVGRRWGALISKCGDSFDRRNLFAIRSHPSATPSFLACGRVPLLPGTVFN